MMRVYLISGLGADQRAFKKLSWHRDVEVVFVPWIKPIKNETLNSYARRLALTIDTDSAPYVLVGLSFGGMLASEMVTFLNPTKTILLSSVNTCNELPVYYRLPGKLGLHRLLPAKPGNRANFLISWLFGIDNKTDKALLSDVLANTDAVFSRWAIDAILKWKKTSSDKEVIRVHGTKDYVLPITNFTPDYIVKQGGHLMVMNRAEEVSRILNEVVFGG